MIDLKKKDDDESMFDPGLGFTIFPMARVRQIYYLNYQFCYKLHYLNKNIFRKEKKSNAHHFHLWIGILMAMNMIL